MSDYILRPVCQAIIVLVSLGMIWGICSVLHV